ncbi:MAG: acetyl/propionyl/methylcrotonyl-CoA carboxylase subunit alpha [Pseudomonadota bacterium]
MFDKILIANRGEIARRIIRTARRLGVRSVAVYSDVDAEAMHIADADEAIALGGASAADSYLRGDLILEAAQRCGAKAIHPGYGFLSENPEFAQAVEAAGLVFIGPTAEAIRAMGLKDAAKSLMEDAGVPVVPGYHGSDQSDGRLASAAEDIGYPVLIKAVAGGGGKGMRKVDGSAGFAEALQSARSEALSAFGNDDVLIERFVARPRHIEVQVFGDGDRAVHLFERDCSLQRRHQKVIEEAPAPGMTQEMRAAMGTAAVRAAEAIGYKGAGTVEFIVDGSDGLRPDGFYFMEMNTRLQVEHPVTEAITGVDLVEWQLRVAAGEALPVKQDALSIRGHAFEARLYAEDVPAGFLPATGRLTHLRFPDDVRVESSVRVGDEISPYYDPMIAKLIVHAGTREQALRAMDRALNATEVAGSVTNLAFLGALTKHSGFASGVVDTGLIARDIDALTRLPEVESRHWVVAAMVATGLDAPGQHSGFVLWQPLSHRLRLTCGDMTAQLRVEVQNSDHQVWWVNETRVDVQRRGDKWWIDGHAAPRVHAHKGRLTVFDHFGLVFDLSDTFDRIQEGTKSKGALDAPMPGLVKWIFVEKGQTVAAGDSLAVLEAMKMEHALTAPRDGVIAEVLVSEGEQVAAEAPLFRLEEEDT